MAVIVAKPEGPTGLTELGQLYFRWLGSVLPSFIAPLFFLPPPWMPAANITPLHVPVDPSTQTYTCQTAPFTL